MSEAQKNRTLTEVALDNPPADESLRQLGATLLAVNVRRDCKVRTPKESPPRLKHCNAVLWQYEDEV